MSAETVTHRGMLTLALLELDGVGPAGARRILSRTKIGEGPKDLWQYVYQSVQEALSRDRTVELQGGRAPPAEIVRQLAETDSYVVVQGDADYPANLFRQAALQSR